VLLEVWERNEMWDAKPDGRLPELKTTWTGLNCTNFGNGETFLYSSINVNFVFNLID